MTQEPAGVELSGPRAGQVPTEDDLYWVAAMRQVQIDAMAATHWAAAGVLIAALAGWILVTAAILFGPTDHAESRSAVIWIIPFVFWSLSMAWSLRVFSLRRYRYFANSPDSAHQGITRIARKKIQYLHWALGFWAAGVIGLIVALLFDS